LPSQTLLILIDRLRPLDEDGVVVEASQAARLKRDVGEMITSIDGWVARGSQLTLFCNERTDDRMGYLFGAGMDESSFENLTLNNVEGNPLMLGDLMECRPQDFAATIILSEQRELEEGIYENPLDVDSRVLVTAVLTRDIQRQEHGAAYVEKCTVVSEVLDPRTLNLIKTSKLNDFVCVNDMVSMRSLKWRWSR